MTLTETDIDNWVGAHPSSCDHDFGHCAVDDEWIIKSLTPPPPRDTVVTDLKQEENNLFQRIRQAIENARRLR